MRSWWRCKAQHEDSYLYWHWRCCLPRFHPGPHRALLATFWRDPVPRSTETRTIYDLGIDIPKHPEWDMSTSAYAFIPMPDFLEEIARRVEEEDEQQPPSSTPHS